MPSRMTYREYIHAVEREIFRATMGMLHRDDLADTVFLHDRYEDQVSPRETAIEILENDSIGSAFLAELGGGF